jgi:hypothetical protein
MMFVNGELRRMGTSCRLFEFLSQRSIENSENQEIRHSLLMLTHISGLK